MLAFGARIVTPTSFRQLCQGMFPKLIYCAVNFVSQNVMWSFIAHSAQPASEELYSADCRATDANPEPSLVRHLVRCRFMKFTLGLT